MASILFVHDHPNPTANDTIFRDALVAAGHTVTYQSESTTAQTSGFDAVVISESGSSTSTTQWDTNPMPVVCLETSWNNLRMSSAGATNPNATTQYDLLTHALTAGLPDPLTWRTGSSGNYGVPTSSLPAGVTTVATPNGTATHATVAVAESGATLTSGTAPARRACTGLGVGSAPAALTADGKALFVEIVEWAAGAAAPTNVGRDLVLRNDILAANVVGRDLVLRHNIDGTVGRDLVLRHNILSPVTLPGQVAGVEPETHGYCAPIIDTNGNLYRITESVLAESNQPKAMKSADGGQTWVEQDAANRPGTDTGSIGDLESGWITREPGFLTFTWQRSYSVYSRFRTSDHPTNPDTWVANTREQVSSASGSPQNMCHTSPTDQAYQWMFFQNGAAASYRSRTGPGSYGTQADIDSAGMGPYATLGNNNVSHIAYIKSGQVHYKTLTSGGTLSGSSTRVDTNGVNTVPIPHAKPVAYMDGADEIVTVMFVNGSAQPRAVDLTNGTPGAEQTISTGTVMLDPDITVNQSAVMSMDVDGTTAHAIWSDGSTGDVMHSQRPHGGAWSTPDVLVPLTGTSQAQWAYCRVLERPGGARVLGYTYDIGPHGDDASAIWYNELALAAPPPPAFTGWGFPM